MLRQLWALGRATEVLAVGENWCQHASRAMAAQPKMTLEQYVADMRAKIADAYADRVDKYDKYVKEFETFIANTGLPRANDFDGVKKFAQKRAEMLKKVQFPDDWKASSEQAQRIKQLLDNVASERKSAAESGAAGKWYLRLSDQQIAECKKDPQLFVELSKLNDFEDQFNAASKAQASKFGLPAITLDELPATMDPMTDTTVSQKEVQWIVKKARESAEKLKKTDPRFADPYNTEEFKQEQQRVADRFGMSGEKLQQLQQQATPEKWKQMEA